MLGSTRKNLDLFYQLCGKDALKNVILGTTKWADVKREVGLRREGQLAQNHWKDMLTAGAEMAQFKGTHKSAWDIVGLIVQREEAIALHIQEELVDLGQSLPDTDAGKTLRFTLEELARAQKEMAQRLERTPGDEERYKETQRQLISTLNQIQELKIPLGRRLLNIIGL